MIPVRAKSRQNTVAQLSQSTDSSAILSNYFSSEMYYCQSIKTLVPDRKKSKLKTPGYGHKRNTPIDSRRSNSGKRCSPYQRNGFRYSKTGTDNPTKRIVNQEFILPKGALTHHPINRAVVSFPLVRLVRSAEGYPLLQATSKGGARYGNLSYAS